MPYYYTNINHYEKNKSTKGNYDKAKKTNSS